MGGHFTRDQITTGYGIVPNGLWTLGTTHGAKILLGWLHSHSDEFLAGLTVNGCRKALGSSAVLTWLIDLERLGFVQIFRGDNGTRSRFRLLGEPWVALQNRSETGSPTDPKQDRYRSEVGSVTDPKQDRIEEHREQPSQNNQTPLPPKGGESDADVELFTTFWQGYPHRRRTGKPAALRAFKAVRRKGHAAEDVMRGLRRWTAHWDAAGTADQFIPHPSTWLNQERWNDPCPAVVPVALSRNEKSQLAIAKLAGRPDRSEVSA